jgi:hypothetical protein
LQKDGDDNRDIDDNVGPSNKPKKPRPAFVTTSYLIQECDNGQLPSDNGYYRRDHVDPAGTHSYDNVLRTEPLGVSPDTKHDTDDKKGLADTEKNLQMVSSVSCLSHGIGILRR